MNLVNGFLIVSLKHMMQGLEDIVVACILGTVLAFVDIVLVNDFVERIHIALEVAGHSLYLQGIAVMDRGFLTQGLQHVDIHQRCIRVYRGFQIGLAQIRSHNAYCVASIHELERLVDVVASHAVVASVLVDAGHGVVYHVVTAILILLHLLQHLIGKFHGLAIVVEPDLVVYLIDAIHVVALTVALLEHFFF